MDFSNKALALILVVATSISLVGTLLTLDRLNSGSYTTGPAYGISAHAVADTGTSNFSINSSISIVFLTPNYADFGAGIVNGSGAHNCTLNTSGPGMLSGSSNPINGPDCIGFNAVVEPLRIQNQGTQNVTLNISFNVTKQSFVTGTLPEFGFIASSNETGACGNGSNQNISHTTYTSVATANLNYTLCNLTQFNWVSGNRTFNLDLGMRIPQDALPGARYVAITAYASSP